MTEEAIPKKSQHARKQQPRSLATQRKLLVAAIEAFSENGFRGTSTREIAERAGLHHPVITYHFRNKKQLWRSAADAVFKDFNTALAGSLQQHEAECPKARMVSLIRAYVQYTGRQPAVHRLVIHEASNPGPRLDWLVETHLQPMLNTAFGLMEELQRLGIAPDGNPKLLFNMIRMTSGGLLAAGNELKKSSDIDTAADEVLDEIVDMIVRVFLPGEAAAPDC